MESFIHFYQHYLSCSTRHILKTIYFDEPFKKKKKLWIATLLTIVTIMVIFVWFREAPWVPFPILIVGSFWAHSFWQTLTKQYAQYYADSLTKQKLSFYGDSYQYLRYLLFKEKVNQNPANITSGIDDSLKYLEIALSTEHKPAVTSHPFIALITTMTITVIGGSVGLWGGQTIMIIFSWLIIILLVGFMLINVSKGKKARYLEFKRFLMWLKDDS